jgi:hypothetical protein
MIRALFLCMLVLAGGISQASGAERFVSVIEDLPLMDGLIENENAAVTFETAGGRIAEAEARGNASPEAVMGFYAGVLPQLGWTVVSPGLYQRERERLKLAIEADGDGGAVVGFSVSPLTR